MYELTRILTIELTGIAKGEEAKQVLDKEIVRQRIVDFFEDAFYPDDLHVSVQDFEMEKDDEHTD